MNGLQQPVQRSWMPERVAHGAPRFYVGLARDGKEILEAQRLRYRVFVEELGARLQTRQPGVDCDYYDAFCDHLVVCDEDSSRVVGTYRLLAPEAARRAGSYYAETEFNIDRLRHLRGSTVELGRACIDSEFRMSGAIALLWSGIVRYMRQSRCEYLMGCASIGMADGGHAAVSIYRQIEAFHMAPPEYRVFPNCPLPLHLIAPCSGAGVDMPPLIRAYLRAGAYVCGEPAWDPDFNTADLPMLLSMARITARYARHFVERRIP